MAWGNNSFYVHACCISDHLVAGFVYFFCLINVTFDPRKQDLHVHYCVRLICALSGCSCVFVCLPPACLHTASALLILSSAVRPGCRFSRELCERKTLIENCIYNTSRTKQQPYSSLKLNKSFWGRRMEQRSVIVKCVLTFLPRTCRVFQYFILFFQFNLVILWHSQSSIK